MKKISVIVPVYNAEEYLERCINSILNQSYENIEIILINDGSKDTSVDICKKYQEKHENIIFISQKNKGPGPARNKGIDISTGDYISFVDADDYIHKDIYVEMISKAEKHGADIVQCDYFIADKFEENISGNHLRGSTVIIEGEYNCSFEYVKQDRLNNFLWNKLFKKEMFYNVRIPSLFAAEDQYALTQLFYKCRKLIIIPTAYYYYFMSPGSLTREKFNLNRLDNIEGGKLMYNFHSKRYEDLASFSALFICSQAAQLYAQIRQTNIHGKEKIEKELLDDFNAYYSIAKESMAIKYASNNRKFLVRLFHISPKLTSFIYRWYQNFI